ncbi:LINE-1 retrotransposable element ORF1 protein [Dissostichus eleginoides]|uniref:LINE-1 retrotransposable element ORF1 protein n=1 Tax=Dissostichus eleginoides TaxID=100907 RepID=A0AAD9C3I0_DISEL|nr:LINE-1 retrotransposable element ORF1 protein [Dissostichus eleginoides]
MIWSRRSNLRLVGIPERKEGTDMCAFLEKWIPDVLGASNFPGPLLIERAHRIGKVTDAEAQPPARPRVVIMKFLNYADKSRIMQAARMKGPILLDNQRVMFFPDISAQLLKRRKVFDGVKREGLFQLENYTRLLGIYTSETASGKGLTESQEELRNICRSQEELRNICRSQEELRNICRSQEELRNICRSQEELRRTHCFISFYRR